MWAQEAWIPLKNIFEITDLIPGIGIAAPQQQGGFARPQNALQTGPVKGLNVSFCRFLEGWQRQVVSLLRSNNNIYVIKSDK